MRKLMGVTAALLLLTAGSVAAQTSSGTVDATARVLASITASSPVDLAFGTIVPGAGAVDVAPGQTYGDGRAVGSLMISHNSPFTTTVTTSSALTHVSVLGANLPTSFLCAYSDAATGTLEAPAVDCSSFTAQRGVAALGTATTSYLQVGGQVTVDAAAVPGDYQGSITFTFTATGF